MEPLAQARVSRADLAYTCCMGRVQAYERLTLEPSHARDHFTSSFINMPKPSLALRALLLFSTHLQIRIVLRAELAATEQRLIRLLEIDHHGETIRMELLMLLLLVHFLELADIELLI